MTINSNLWVRLAWILRVVQSISGETFRMKMREEKEEHAVLLSVLLIMTEGGRSGDECRRVAFSEPGLSRPRFLSISGGKFSFLFCLC
jgi:hypothetical protein